MLLIRLTLGVVSHKGVQPGYISKRLGVYGRRVSRFIPRRKAGGGTGILHRFKDERWSNL